MAKKKNQVIEDAEIIPCEPTLESQVATLNDQNRELMLAIDILKQYKDKAEKAFAHLGLAGPESEGFETAIINFQKSNDLSKEEAQNYKRAWAEACLSSNEQDALIADLKRQLEIKPKRSIRVAAMPTQAVPSLDW